MLSPKRLVEKAKKGLPLMRSNSRSSSCDFNNIVVAEKGHFVVYSMDDARFVVPLSFLKSCIFQELLKVSAEEFGLPGEGPITLACSGVFMEYVVSLLKRSVSRDVELALLASIDSSRCSDSSLVGLGCDQQRIVV
ncbi:auxin-responsive protein SAUR64-like [Zingiber officinale]|uniref:auxin-responsive protein SAUR64-like n=1 Tax=Zingiber officinale TaxID=94328 RepID=UPI001C4CDBBC|nr:auxin-responsive protein SAUR64-like [Zingiber officinale]